MVKVVHTAAVIIVLLLPEPDCMCRRDLPAGINPELILNVYVRYTRNTLILGRFRLLLGLLTLILGSVAFKLWY